MLCSLKNVTECAIGATDGPIGHVRDTYFDDEAWVLRYLVVDTGPRGFNRSVLIPPVALGEPKWGDKLLPVSLSIQQVLNSPEIDTRRPVSRQHALSCLDYYTGLGYAESDAEYRRARTANVKAGVSGDSNSHDDPHLRSANEVSSYHVHATDGDIGHVQGLLIDQRSWAIRFMIVSTSHWWRGHQVLIAPESIDDVQWSDARVIVELTRQAVKESPTYEAGVPFNNVQGERTYQHYGLAGYRSAEATSPSHSAHI